MKNETWDKGKKNIGANLRVYEFIKSPKVVIPSNTLKGTRDGIQTSSRRRPGTRTLNNILDSGFHNLKVIYDRNDKAT